MESMLAALYAEYKGNENLLAALSGGLYRSEAPQDTSFPYGTIHIISVVPDNTFTELGEVATIQFNLFDDTRSSATITDIFEKLKTCYDEADMTVTGYNHVYLLRDNSFPIRVDGIWQYSVQYRWFIQKSR